MKLPFQRKPRRAAELKPRRQARVAAAEPDGADLGRGEGFSRREEVASILRREPGSAAARQLAGDILEGHLALGRRGLAICGPAASAGVDEVASGLAVALAMQSTTVLLVDARPHLPAHAELAPEAREQGGLAGFLLDGSARLQEFVQREVVPGLDVLAAGDLSADQLDGEGLARFAAEALRLYDCTLMCAPPANRSAGVLAVARSMGHALLVARESVTFYEDLVQVSGELRKDGVNIVGSVLIEAP